MPITQTSALLRVAPDDCLLLKGQIQLGSAAVVIRAPHTQHEWK